MVSFFETKKNLFIEEQKKIISCKNFIFPTLKIIPSKKFSEKNVQ